MGTAFGATALSFIPLPSAIVVVTASPPRWSSMRSAAHTRFACSTGRPVWHHRSSSQTSPTMIESRIVEAACGECQFAMPGQGCDLAVRMDGQSYFVDGTGIDDHGDAHGSEGLCNAVRRARISGEVREGRFVATSFELLP